MIQLKHKLRSNAKILVLIDKYAPDSFDLKIAKTLDNVVQSSINKYQNFNYSSISEARYRAKCYEQESLRRYPIIKRLEEQYFVDNGEGSLLAFYKPEIDEFNDVRNSAVPGRVFIYEGFNLTNKAVAKLMAVYANIIELFCSNYFAILRYENNLKEEEVKGSTTIVYEHNYYSVIFHNMMTIDTYRQINLETCLKKLQSKYINNDYGKIKKAEARIIEYFLSKTINLNFNYKDHSKRQKSIKELYDISYATFRADYNTEFLNVKGDPNIEIEPLEKAILYVNYKINCKEYKDVFTVELLKNMYDYYLIMING